MQTNIQKWGNSLGVRIPVHMVQALSIHAGIAVDILMENKQIIIRPKKYSLHDLVDQITEENKHPLQYNDDEVVGLEEW